MKVVVKEPIKRPYVKEIVPNPEYPNTIGLEPLQELVGGLIEYVCLSAEDKIDFVINEEGKLIGLPLNFGWCNDVIVGNAVFVSSDDEGNTLGLTEKQIADVLSSFAMLYTSDYTVREFEEDTMFM